jgi:L-amino acid N-acyltransferase YncA
MNIRKAKAEDAAGIARVHVDSWRTTYKNIVSDEFLERMSYEERENIWKRALGNTGSKQCIYVAENHHGEIVGFASGGKERSGNYPDFDSELYAIYLLAEVRRMGVGRRLFHCAVDELKEQGFLSMLVWVLADNDPARTFYESFEPEQIDSEMIEIGGEQFEEVAYGWREIRYLDIPSITKHEPIVRSESRD